MHGLMYPQRRDFLGTLEKLLGKTPEEADPEALETYLQIELPSNPELREKIYEDCRTYKRVKGIKLAEN